MLLGVGHVFSGSEPGLDDSDHRQIVGWPSYMYKGSYLTHSTCEGFSDAPSQFGQLSWKANNLCKSKSRRFIPGTSNPAIRLELYQTIPG